MPTTVSGFPSNMEHGIIKILCLFILQGVMIFKQHILGTNVV